MKDSELRDKWIEQRLEVIEHYMHLKAPSFEEFKLGGYPAHAAAIQQTITQEFFHYCYVMRVQFNCCKMTSVPHWR